MKGSALRTLCASLVFLSALSGCEDPKTPTFDELVEQVFEPSCNSGGCHGATSGAGGLFLDSERAYDSLMNTAVVQFDAAEAGWERVVAGDPDNSFLVLKLKDPEGMGDAMPPSESLSKAQIKSIEAWIRDGAED